MSVVDLTDQVVPPPPSDEIPRDASVRQIAKCFGAECQVQLVVGNRQTGKTNLLSQYARQHKDRSISYFITSNPLTQRPSSFLYSMCLQLSQVLGNNPPPANMPQEEMKSLFASCCIGLGHAARSRGPYYFVIDGLEYAVDGHQGDRIIDVFPPTTAPRGPFLLFSCRTDQVHRLGEVAQCTRVEPLPFQIHEARTYLQGLGFSEEELSTIQSKYQGIPGYLRIIKERKRADTQMSVDRAPRELNDLLRQHLDQVCSSVDASVNMALEYLAVSPCPLDVQLLAQLVQSDGKQLADALARTGVARCDLALHKAEYSSEQYQAAMKARLGSAAKDRIRSVIERMTSAPSQDQFALTLLYREARDYPGVQTLLSTPAILRTVKAAGDVSNAMRSLHLASEMAREQGDIKGLFRWTLGTAAVKALISDAANEAEIEALLAVGSSQDAIRKAYGMPEAATRIRLLATAYSAMRRGGQRVPKGAREELRVMVENLRKGELDSDVLLRLAIDILPILPDNAMSLLEETMRGNEKDSLVEAATAALIERDLRRDDGPPAKEKTPISAEFLARFAPSWLAGLALRELLADIGDVQSTKAKEYVVRQWCRYNQGSEDVGRAVATWLDTVVGDRQFVIPLRSLRRMSELLLTVAVDQRAALIGRMRAPELAGIDSPREEWVRYQLNMCEALLPIDAAAALDQLRHVYASVVKEPLDLDLKAFCLARVWSTMSRAKDVVEVPIVEVRERFEAALRELLADSAEHFEIVRGAIETLAEVDPGAALAVARDLNVPRRRTQAVLAGLRTALRRKGEVDLSGFILDALASLDRPDMERALPGIIADLDERGCAVSRPNVDVLQVCCDAITDPTLRAQGFASLASLLRNTSIDEAMALADRAVQCWRSEDDLKIRLSLGFALVRVVAKLNTDRARALCEEVQQLHALPGSALAVSRLGGMFRELLDLAIRALTLADVGDADQQRCMGDLISRIPARLVRAQLYATLASSFYRLGCDQYGDQVVHDKVLPEIAEIDSRLDREVAVEYALPIVYRYDQGEAHTIARTLPQQVSDRAWHSVALWLLSGSLLGDHLLRPDEIRVRNGYPVLLRAVAATEQIRSDMLVYSAIEAASRSVEASFDAEIDLVQALEVLGKLDAVAASHLPDASSIRHEGYLVVCEAAIHRARSVIYHRLRSKRNLSKEDIGRRWQQIRARAEAIPNAADRAYVMALVAKAMADYYRNDHVPVKALLDQATLEVERIPALIDRVDRLETLSDSWRRLGEKTEAQFLLETAVRLAEQMRGATADDRLRIIVQAAYKLSPDLADEIVTKLDSRLPASEAERAHRALRVEQLSGDPTKVRNLKAPEHQQGAILALCTERFLQDLASGRGLVPHTSVLQDWLVRASWYQPGVSLKVAHWVTEALHGADPRTGRQTVVIACLDVAGLVFELAKWTSPAKREGIPEAVQDSFPGLNSRVEVFRKGEIERVERWVQRWMSENAREYVKICDPYFGIDQLVFLRTVPRDCRVVVITTDANLDISAGPAQVTRQVELFWESMVASPLPSVALFVVPRAHEAKFHDRAIVTSKGGLDIGQSLNGLEVP